MRKHQILRGLHVDDTKIWTSGEYMFNYYIDTKDAGYYMSRDRINDLLIQPVMNKVDQNAILACQDRFVRVLDVNKLHYESFIHTHTHMSPSYTHTHTHTHTHTQVRARSRRQQAPL
jgi:hypothetical protein